MAASLPQEFVQCKGDARVLEEAVMITGNDAAYLASFRAVIAERFPELGDAPLTLLSGGWDCVAVDAGGRWLFKLPRNAAAAARLRKEVRLLEVIRPRVGMAVPQMHISDAPLFSWHIPIRGAHLLSADYNALSDAARAELAGAVAGFYADLHAIDLDLMATTGAEPVPAWPSGDRLRETALPFTPDMLKEQAGALTRHWDRLGPDPHGNVYGHFDGHGWNMAFDHTAQRLNGVYDFGDSGIGPLHQEFIYTNFISPDLTARIIRAYEARTGKAIDRRRVDVLTGVHRLMEVAGAAKTQGDLDGMVKNLTSWLERTS
jgi:aminoglycoside phosphotransferase (APT) family kinase protein